MTELTPAARVAAVKDIAVSLLPISATPREKALLAAELARLSLFAPETIATVWNPMTCPVAILPWLAWAVSADVWDATWSEDIKRAVVAAAPAVHRLKGTRAAVQKALDALGIVTEIVEWWQTEPVGRRGTATVTAFVAFDHGDEVILSERVQRQAIAAIRAAKPKSRLVTYRVGVGLKDAFGLAGALQDMVALRPTLLPAIAMPASNVGAIGDVQSISVCRHVATAVPQHPAAVLALLAGASVVQCIRATMEPRP